MKYTPWIIAVCLLVGGFALGFLNEEPVRAHHTTYHPPQHVEVTILGAVHFPKTYSLDTRLTVADALKRAGGTLEEANLSGLRLTDTLSQSFTLHVPFKQPLEDSPVNASLININKASQTELATLPKIGPSYAKAIVDYRTQHGSFFHIEDIKKVSGIGVATYEAIKTLISVG